MTTDEKINTKNLTSHSLIYNDKIKIHIKTNLFIKDNTSPIKIYTTVYTIQPDKQLIKQDINSFEDMMKYISKGNKIQMVLELDKLSCARSAKKCYLPIKCRQLLVTEFAPTTIYNDPAIDFGADIFGYKPPTQIDKISDDTESESEDISC